MSDCTFATRFFDAFVAHMITAVLAIALLCWAHWAGYEMPWERRERREVLAAFEGRMNGIIGRYV